MNQLVYTLYIMAVPKRWHACMCGKRLSSYHSLWRHRKKCNFRLTRDIIYIDYTQMLQKLEKQENNWKVLVLILIKEMKQQKRCILISEFLSVVQTLISKGILSEADFKEIRCG